MSADDGKGMRAVILVGGFGTRLRPLTLTAPKPLVPFCNKPMIIHQIEALKKVGVTEVILAVAYRPEAMKAEMDEWSKKLGVSFVFSVEEEPLGTAGPLSLARDILMQDDKPFFVLNSDVTCLFPMEEMLAFHKAHGAEGTIMVTKVVEWDKYGVVVYSPETQQIERFVEKPKTFVGDRINAGIYIFNKSILNRIPPAPHLHREGDLPSDGVRQAALRLQPGGLLDGRGPAQGLHSRHDQVHPVPRRRPRDGGRAHGGRAARQGRPLHRARLVAHRPLRHHRRGRRDRTELVHWRQVRHRRWQPHQQLRRAGELQGRQGHVRVPQHRRVEQPHRQLVPHRGDLRPRRRRRGQGRRRDDRHAGAAQQGRQRAPAAAFDHHVNGHCERHAREVEASVLPAPPLIRKQKPKIIEEKLSSTLRTEHTRVRDGTAWTRRSFAKKKS